MSNFEVETPILNSPFKKPEEYWHLREGEPAERRPGRRPSVVYPPSDTRKEWDISDGVLRRSREFAPGFEMVMVNAIREKIADWRSQGYPGASRTTIDLIQWWTRDGRRYPLFFAQLEAAETIIFLKEARQDFLQGIRIPLDEPSDAQKAEGAKAFLRYACKMATGSGKTTVMGMLAAWSILNKVNDRGNTRYSDVVLVVCPNVTIKNRLQELKPELGEASIYRSRDLIPDHLMPILSRGRVLVTNWHLFELQGQGTAKVQKTGIEKRFQETIHIREKTTTAHRYRYMTPDAFDSLVVSGKIQVLNEHRDSEGNLEKVEVESVKYVESDTAWVNRILGREVGGKQNILVMNDEAHHAYRIRQDVEDNDDEEDAEEFYQEATVWVEGLDRIHKHRGINFCVDLSATPYFLGRVGQDTNKPFPWVVSDFGLTDSIESGLVKIPQLALRDPTGAEHPAYFNIWKWIMEEKLTTAERGGKKGQAKPEAILKYSDHPIKMLGGYWENERKAWEKNEDDPRPPVYILVCKTTRIADMVYDWLAHDRGPTGIPPCGIEGLRNTFDKINTIVVHSKKVYETDSGTSKDAEDRWMRITLDTVGKTEWPTDRQGRPIYPDDFEELAEKLEMPLHPPGRDVRCIVSVGMLTEGWDCKTVTHIIGIRPFMSQLLCEQVAGRGLRRTNYEVDEEGKFTEEVAKILGVPFEVVPYKAGAEGPPKPNPDKKHVHAVPEKEQFRIEFPRIEGYAQAVRNRVALDWESVPKLFLDPTKIPPEVDMQVSIPTVEGQPFLNGPWKQEIVDLNPYRKERRLQQLVFSIARDLTRVFSDTEQCEVPTHVLFPQMLKISEKYMNEKVEAIEPARKIDVFIMPYYKWAIERLLQAIRPDTGSGEAPEIPRYEKRRGPGTTDEVDFWTSKDVRVVKKSHLNYVVADTKKWEQSASYFIDSHKDVEAFVKNAGLGFSIPYMYNGDPHDYLPDFIIRLKTDGETHCHLILETKGFDPLEEVKKEAALRWVNAINVDGKFGIFKYAIARKPTEVNDAINMAANELKV